VPDEAGGQPAPNGEEPDEGRGAEADDAFASVVLDEAFVRAAQVHEPTAAERILAAAQSHAETEAVHTHEDGYVYGPADLDDLDDLDGRGGYGYGAHTPFGYEHEDEYEHGADYGYAYGRGLYGDRPPPYRGHMRWQRPVAWVLAVVMGIGVVALAFTAVYRGASGDAREPSPPPASTGVDSGQDDGPPTVHAPSPAGTARP
jgi:hypothetical protein